MSTRLNGLRAKQGQIIDQMEALLDAAATASRDLTAEELQIQKDLDADFLRVGEAIKAEEQLEARKAALAKPVANPAERKASAVARTRYSKLKAFNKGADDETLAYQMGQWARSMFFGDDKAAAWCRENGIGVTKAQGEGINTAGGFLVPTEFNQAIIDLRETYGLFRQECQVIPMGSDAMTIPRRSGGVTAYWVGENSQITESQKAWDQVSLVAKKLAALTRMSTELAEDAVIQIGDDLAAEMAYAFAKAEDTAGWSGDGGSTYGGVTGVLTRVIDGTHTKSAVNAASGHDTFAEIDNTDLTTLMAALPKYAEAGAKWYVSQPGWSLVFQRLAAAAGGTSIMDLTGAKPQRSYLGYPVVIDQSLPTSTGTLVNKAMLLFGNLGLSTCLAERRGFVVKRSDDRYFEYDQIGIMATERVDIVAHDLGDTATAGPIVALVGA